MPRKGSCTKDGGCHSPLSQGHCDEGEMVVMGRKGSGICVPRLCEEDQVFKAGKCVNVFYAKDCQREGEVLQYNLKGEVVCGCADEWGSSTSSSSIFTLTLGTIIFYQYI